ncbi:MAG: diacylglycerol kinase family lipid kinase [Chloroflexota bacterium]|nr:diacylglycerol kinase family lipid kinase [Chloroflexota bacterium]
MVQKIHVIINPAAGQDEPILNTMNKVFGEAGVEWEVSLTKQAGDARRLAHEAAQSGADVVAVYGGDGTVAEVASGLIGSPVPMAILPGGTANVLSVELGIPTDAMQACTLICDAQHSVRQVDMGLVNDHHFILRVGVGFEAAMVENADRELKNKYGVLAYLWSAVQNLYKPEIAQYHLNLDGNVVEVEGLTCIIANSGNLGQAGINLIPGIDVSDGLLDVIVVQQANLRTFFDIMGSIAGLKQVLTNDSIETGAAAGATATEELRQSLHYWQVKEVSLATVPPQSVQYDGEILGKTDIRCKILPQAIRVIVPTLAKV